MRLEMRIRTAIAAGAALAALAVVGAAERHDGRARHLAVPVFADPSLPLAAAVDLADGPPCAANEAAQVGARVTAILAASDGDLWIGTFDRGLFLVHGGESPGSVASGAPLTSVPSAAVAGEAEAPAAGRGGEALPVPGLRGRQLFVNALAEHDGLVWAATQGGLLALDGERLTLLVLDGEGVTALAVAGGSLVAGTARGLFRASIEDGAERIDATGPGGEPLRVTALAAGGALLWIGTPSGAYSLPLATLGAPLLARTARWHPLVFGDAPAETNVVTALAPLSDGTVAGTDDGGVVRIGLDGTIAAVRFSDPRANEVNPGAAAAGAPGALLGTQGGGLLLARTAGRGLAVVRPCSLARAAISAVSVSTDELLVGTAEGSVLRIRIQGTGFVEFSPSHRSAP